MTILLFLFSLSAFAIPVLHQIRPESSFSQISTLGSCSFMTGRKDGVDCNPALFPFNSEKGVSFNLATISDGESVETGKQLLFSEIKKKDIEKLFEEQSFISWDANTSIRFMTPYFYLFYRPLTVTADLFVFNPAFPEISMALIKSKQVGISSGLKLLDNELVTLSGGATLFHYQRKEYLGHFSLVELTGTDIEDLIDFKTREGVAGDLGLYLDPKWEYLPQVSVLVKNLGSDFHNRDDEVNSEQELRPLIVYETYSKLGLAYRFNYSFGGVGVEASAPFQGVYGHYLQDYTSLSLGYFLGGFEATGALSKYQKMAGFKFSSKSFSVGIFYANNQAMGDFSQHKENLAGIFLQVAL